MEQSKELNAYEKIYEVVKQIPQGKVASYGQIAELAGNRRWVRVVGYALRALKHSENDVPWHRVIKKEGRLAVRREDGGCNIQAKLLEKEGVEVVNDCVDMERFQWKKRLI